MDTATTTAEATAHWSDRRWAERLLEILPGATTWVFLLGPILLSLVEPVWVAYFIIFFDLCWLVKSLRLSFNLIRGYSRFYAAKRINWQRKLANLSNLDAAIDETASWLEAYKKGDGQIAV